MANRVQPTPTEDPRIQQLRDAYHNLSDRDRDFAKSLGLAYAERGLSERQWYWVGQLIKRGTDAAPDLQSLTGLASIVERLTEAKRHLKYPRIRFTTARGNRVVLKLLGGNSQHVGQVSVSDGGPYGEARYYGRITTLGTWDPRHAPDDVVELVTAFAADPAAFAGEYGRKIGACCFCNQTLTDARSTSVGYGPICAEHYGLPWGEVPLTVPWPNAD